MNYHFRIHHEDDGYWGECVEIEGCHSQGKTMEELKLNLQEVLDLVLDEPSESNIIFPEPNLTLKGKDIIEIKADPKIVFAQLLRMMRLKNNMTQKEVADKMGFKHLWSYQKLESSKSSNPSLNTISKVKEVFPEFDMNMVV